MRAVVVSEPGGPEVLTVAEVPDLSPGPGEVLIAVAAAGLNRADLLQRMGFYPPPPGASDVIGMEVSGTIAALGDGVTTWQVGDRVCALLAGGGYASQVVAPAGQVMPIPEGIELVEAAALPEVACTVWSNVFMVGALQPHETFLVHGGAGGIGTMAIQLAHQLGSRVFTTAGSPEKRALCASLGADVVIDYREETFEDVIADHTDGRGVDVILDNMGAKYLARNIDALTDSGRLVIIGLQGGTTAELDINALMRKRAAVIGTTLRSRPVEGKSAICASVVEHVWPLVAGGYVKPVIDVVLPLEKVAEAHRRMEAGEHSGKILLSL
ncbi:MAG: NAD(P)H-quinone oxidoreductase [Nocardioides sp.]|uniref:NAD(P)H-quinone oxidoreductase n=1 Tax=Nocardioides nematodiphilus TaxID=2849669 RepID=UPI001CDA478E|nr:NAD(P)H-quinone oxidoreductase [Nocardioides nematodiphilus]MCA1984615.1 NAD(P)H-quinone oxidoreductase [Nocardioides nematodiphilus]